MTAGADAAPSAPRTAVCTLPRGPVGTGIAHGLAAHGWSVGCVGLAEAPDGLAADLRRDHGTAATALASELDDRTEVRSALEAISYELGPMRLLVHGFPLYPPLPPRPLLDINEAGWAMVCESTMKSTLLVLQAAHDVFTADGASTGGRVVLVVPTFAMSGAPNHVPLAAAAEGVRALAKSAARQWGEVGITVNCVAVDPGTLLGDGAAGASDVSLAVPALPLGDPADDLGPAVAWLGSDEARFVTGQTLVLDGGTWMAR